MPLGKYDAIIVNSSDHAVCLSYTMKKLLLEMLARALRPRGVLCNMAGSMWLHTHLIQDMINVCREIFKGSIHYAWKSVPTYPSGVIGFILCSTDRPPVDFKIPINPIEKVEGALEHRRELKFYKSHISGEASGVRMALFDIASHLHDFPSKTQHLLGNFSAASVPLCYSKILFGSEESQQKKNIDLAYGVPSFVDAFHPHVFGLSSSEWLSISRETLYLLTEWCLLRT
uniref:Spermine synthase n=1 Tax=Tanacetum cinerariifolium TaxID=118510 RepID=A0A6L2JQD8_TANCI|nr:spermine synthase [Tanacetum cinerariifolium]